MLFPVARNLGKFKGTLNNIQHNIAFNADARSDGARDWAAATAHNTVQEYYVSAAQRSIGTPPNKLRILLTNWRTQGLRGATPMYAKRVIQELPEDLLRYYVISVYTPFTSFAPWQYVLKQEVDLTVGYNMFQRTGTDQTAAASDLSETMFHELTHAAHYNKVGNSWWNDFVDGELNNIILHRNDNPPYGPGNQGAISDIIATGESWAYHMGHFMADLKYGLNSPPTFEQRIQYTNNNPVLGLSSHLNSLEDFDPLRNNDPDRWVPIGLYYDLFDTRNEFLAPITDGVSNYTNQQMFNSLDPDVTSIPQYRIRLLQENGNNQAAQVINLFSQYGY